MRGDDRQPDAMFSYVSAEERAPKDHPLRAIRPMVDAALREMSREFDRLYSRVGRPSIPPERLFRALLLQLFYSVRSERLLMEQLDYNILFRWFVGLEMDEPVWAPTVFTKNRERLLNQDVARSFFRRVVELADGLLSDEHFTVDGTLIEAWASQKRHRVRHRPAVPAVRLRALPTGGRQLFTRTGWSRSRARHRAAARGAARRHDRRRARY